MKFVVIYCLFLYIWNIKADDTVTTNVLINTVVPNNNSTELNITLDTKDVVTFDLERCRHCLKNRGRDLRACISCVLYGDYCLDANKMSYDELVREARRTCTFGRFNGGHRFEKHNHGHGHHHHHHHHERF